MESREREALYHLVLSSMDQLLERDEFDAWVEGEIELAPLFKPVFESVARERDRFVRELHQMFPAEVFDRFIAKHPDVEVGDGTTLVVRIGKELEAMKGIVQSV
jgi:hypothetical protein